MTTTAVTHTVEEVIERIISASTLARLHCYSPLVRQRVLDRWRKAAHSLVKIGKISFGNKLTLLRNGDDAFDELWKSLRGAKQRVVMEMYTISDDRVGKRTVNHLTTARQQGKDVVVIYDGVGSVSTSSKIFERLKFAGGVVTTYNPVSYVPWKVSMNRTHRKIVAIDDRVGFIGGMNISTKYAGTRHGTGYFRDVQVKVEGPAVKHMAEVAYQSLKHITTTQQQQDGGVGSTTSPTSIASLSNPLPSPIIGLNTSEGIAIQVLDSDLVANKPEIQRAFRRLIATATEHCYITTPYFLPPKWLKRSLIKAARRGVDVRIITAGKSDVPMVMFASQHIYSAFLKRGVKIYEMVDATLHAKTFTVDGIYSCIGSFNFDFWSGLGNLETNIGTFDPETSALLEQHFVEDIRKCREVTLRDLNRRSYLSRFLHWTCYQAACLLSPPRLLRPISRVVAPMKMPTGTITQ